MTSTTKSFTEVMQIQTFEDRLLYLSCYGKVAEETFGTLRWMTQELYKSPEWLDFRRDIILRDECCDLAHPDYPLDGYYDKEQDRVINKERISVHHINVLLPCDLANNSRRIFDPENVITCSGQTHRYIHYGTPIIKPRFVERRPNDTCPWKR